MMFEKIDHRLPQFQRHAVDAVHALQHRRDDQVFRERRPVHGETVTLLKAPAGTRCRATTTGTVIVYTVKGAWKYVEHDWVAREGSVVYETASTRPYPAR